MFGFQWPMSITTEREIYWSGLAAENGGVTISHVLGL